MFDFDSISKLAAIAVPICSVAGLGWWLRDQFAKMAERNQNRHEDNLKEFGKIYVALTQLGWRNGGQRS